MRATLITLGTTAAAAMALCPVAQAAVAPFDFSYEGDALPGASTPAWQTHFGGTGTSESASGGILTLSTDFNGATPTDLLHRIDAGSSWAAGAAGSTLEVRLKVDQVRGTGAGDFGFSTGSKFFKFQFRGTEVEEVATGDDFPLTTTDDFHIYRFVLTGTNGPVDVYVDNNPVAVLTTLGTAGAANRIDWGDDLGSSLGQIQWDYIAWTNDGAFAPIPEPSSMLSLAGLGLLGLLRRVRRGA